MQTEAEQFRCPYVDIYRDLPRVQTARDGGNPAGLSRGLQNIRELALLRPSIHHRSTLTTAAGMKGLRADNNPAQKSALT